MTRTSWPGVGALLAMVLLAAALVGVAAAEEQNPTPILVEDWTSGDAAAECANIPKEVLIAAGWTGGTCGGCGYKIEWNQANPGTHNQAYAADCGNTITISGATASTFDWDSTYPVCTVIVKAANDANLYVYTYDGATGDNDLVAPEAKEISHVTFCYAQPTPDPKIDIEKATNGEWDICYLAEYGEQIVWTYWVTNPGNVPVSDVVVTDDAGTPSDTTDDFSPTYVSGDDNNDGLLDTTEKWIYTQNGPLADYGDVYTNTATVTGKYYEQEVTDADESCYSGPEPILEPGIQIVKKVSADGITWADADTAEGTDVPEISKDCPVYWKYVVTNTGNVDLIDLEVTDDQGVTPVLDTDDPDGIGDDDDVFNPNDVWIYYAEGTSTGAPYANNGTAAASFGSTVVTDDDPAHYTGITTSPALTVSKEADCEEVLSGTEVTYTVWLNNTGDVEIPAPVVTDNDVSLGAPDSGDDGDGNLDATENWKWEYTSTVTQDTTNTVAVDASYTDTCGTVTDLSTSDSVTVTVLTPAIAIVKENCAEGGNVIVGKPVTFEYTVTNTGDVPLSDVTVTDDAGTAADTTDDFDATYDSGDTDEDEYLDLDETWLFKATVTEAGEGTVTNTATAEGTASAGCGDPADVSDTDDSTYTGVSPAINILKTTNGYECGDPAAPKIYKGDTVTWTYEVSGANLPVSNVVVTDDAGTAADTSDDFSPTLVSGDDADNILEPGETWTYSKTGNAIQGPYQNTAELAGDVTDTCGNTADVTDSSSSCYFGWTGSTVCGLGYKTPLFFNGGDPVSLTRTDFAKILSKDRTNWFMYLTVTPESIPDGGSMKFDIQMGNPYAAAKKVQLIDVGDVTIARSGTTYTITKDLNTWTFNGYEYGIYVVKEHLGIDYDSKMSFTGSPGTDDNTDYVGDVATIIDADNQFFVFAHWSVEFGPTPP